MHNRNSGQPALSTTITIVRTDLIAELEARIDTVNTNTDAFLVEVDAAIKEQDDHVKKVRNWHYDIAKGLRNGSYDIDPDTGKLVKGSNSATPPAPKPTRQRQNDDVRGFRMVRKTVEQERQRCVKPLKNAIDMLNLTSQPTIEVSTGDYQSLLAVEYAPQWGDYRGWY